jgi:hypothetical protein
MRSPTKKPRHKDDFYETPGKLTRELLNRVDISGTIFEPCAGSSAITKVLKEKELSRQGFAMGSNKSTFQ